jgi:hypothetical protein
MRLGGILTILCALVPAVAGADETPKRPEPAPAPAARRWPNPADVVAPGVLRQDLFDRRNPANWRNDYPTPPAQAGQY